MRYDIYTHPHKIGLDYGAVLKYAYTKRRMKAYGYGVAGLKYDGGDHPRREEGVPRYVRIAALKGERDRIKEAVRAWCGVVRQAGCFSIHLCECRRRGCLRPG